MRKAIWVLLIISSIYQAVADQSVHQSVESVVLFLVDSSGSMKRNDAADLRLQAIRDFVSLGSGNAHFVLTSFDSQARCHYSGEVATVGQKVHFDDALNAMGTEGKQTSLDAGFRGALAELEKYAHAEKTVILLTDAINTDTYENTHRSLFAQGIRVYAIGLGQANTNVLRTISTETDGTWFIADGSRNLLVIYRKIASRVLHRAVLLSKDDIDICDNGQFAGEWYLEEGASMLCVSVGGKLGEAVIVLVTPDNMEVAFQENQRFPGINIHRTEHWCALLMEIPPPGHYQLIIRMKTQGSVSIRADASSSIQACVDSEKPYYRHGESAVLNLTVNGDVHLDTTDLFIAMPGGETQQLPVPTNSNAISTQYFTPPMTGRYMVVLDVAGVDRARGSFTRQASCSFEVLTQPTTFQISPITEITIEPRYPDLVDFSANVIGREGAKGAVSLVKASPSDRILEGFSLSAQRVALRPGDSSQMKFSLRIPEELKAGRYSFDLVFKASHSQEVFTSPFTLIAKPMAFTKRILRIAPWVLAGGALLIVIVWSAFIARREEDG